MLIFLIEGNIQCLFQSWLSIMESKKSEMGMGKVNRQGSKDEPGKRQRILSRNFMLIYVNIALFSLSRKLRHWRSWTLPEQSLDIYFRDYYTSRIVMQY
jgi:hypothetical protein